MKLVNYNVSVGWQVLEKFRVGATLTYGFLDLESSLVNTYLDPTGQVLGVPELAGVPLEMFRTEADDSDTALSWTVGLQWRPIDVFAIGAVYRAGGDFEIEETVTGVPTDPSLRPGQITERLFFNETGNLLASDFTTFSFTNHIHIPDVAVLGVSYRPLEPLTLSLDAEHIWYSDLVDDFNSRLNVLTVGWATEEEAAFTVDDATNLHFGVEYALPTDPGKTGWDLRFGYRQDKDSRIRSNFAPGGFGLASNENFPPGEDLDHFTAGVGVVFGKSFQLDAAVDYSSDAVEAVTSFIVRF
jgi:long-subunit fatty acid transport protein